MSDPAALDRLVEDLAAHGFAVAERFVDAGLSRALEAEALALAASGGHSAGIGRGGAHARDDAIRRARIRWLDAGTDAQRDFLALAETLRLALNRKLFLGLFDFEAQLALSEPGGFYARHRDSLAGAANRVVSLVAYCNRDWGPDDGGELAIWRDDTGPPVRTVRPECGTLVLMLSADIPHEARPARRTRTSVAGWFRVNASDGARADPAR